MENKKVSFRFILLSLPVIILFFAAISGAIYRVEHKSQKQAAHRTGRQAAEGTAIALQNWIGDQIRMAQMIADDARVIQALKNPKDARFGSGSP